MIFVTPPVMHERMLEAGAPGYRAKSMPKSLTPSQKKKAAIKALVYGLLAAFRLRAWGVGRHATRKQAPVESIQEARRREQKRRLLGRKKI